MSGRTVRHLALTLGTLFLSVLAVIGVAGYSVRVPKDHWHPAQARVTAIADHDGKLFPGEEVAFRNASGTGQAHLGGAVVRCHVGDVVPVEQSGVTLRPVVATCR